MVPRTCAECGAEIAPDERRFDLIREPPGGSVTDRAAYDEWLCSGDCVSETATRLSRRRGAGVLSRDDPISDALGVAAGFAVTAFARRSMGEWPSTVSGASVEEKPHSQ